MSLVTKLHVQAISNSGWIYIAFQPSRQYVPAIDLSLHMLDIVLSHEKSHALNLIGSATSRTVETAENG